MPEPRCLPSPIRLSMLKTSRTTADRFNMLRMQGLDPGFEGFGGDHPDIQNFFQVLPDNPEAGE